VLVLVLVGLPAIRASTGQRQAPPEDPRPNVVLIVSDDQRWDTLWAMPTVRRQIANAGVTFENGYVVNPACCPSRASILTGQYSHSTGVWRNHGSDGGFRAFDDSSTLATWLDGAGYRTGLFGKYLNGYVGTTYVPPGWDRWMAFDGQHGHRTGNYLNYDLNVDGEIVSHFEDPAEYSTDLLAEEAVRFVQDGDEPFFLMFTPPPPHNPALPAARYADALGDLERWRPSSYNETDMADKPTWVALRRSLDAESAAELDELRQNQLESLLALDDAVGEIVQGIRRAGELGNTVFVYLSDNGYLLGEHRLTGKSVPYEESIRVPFLFRYDELGGAGLGVSEQVLNIDLAPTIAELTGIEAPGVEGTSLVPLITGEGAWTRKAFVVEHLGPTGPEQSGTGIPSFCAVHTERYVYVMYAYGLNDLYDLRQDPAQLNNLALTGLPSVEHRLGRIGTSLCDPPPPGMDGFG
jgi:arylsulfatase A-like enzyme